MSNLAFVIAAYAVTWITITSYALLLIARRRKLQRESGETSNG